MKIKLSELRRIIREVIEAGMDEAEKKDLNDDGKNDFEDVMIARMKASGMPHEKAVKKAAKGAKKRKNERAQTHAADYGN